MIRPRSAALFGATAFAIFASAFFVHTVAAPTKNNASNDAGVAASSFDQSMVWASWKIYCDTCHTGPKARAGLNLEALDLAHLDRNGETWEKLLKKLRNREMPPPGAPRPDESTYLAMIKSIEGERDRLVDAKPNPGRPTLHRLNRVEYANAVRDLLSLEFDVSEFLPPDDAGYGFDNIGDVLTVTPSLLEKYLLAAGKISRQAVGDTKIPVSFETHSISHALKQDDRMEEELDAGSRGGAIIQHRFPVDGEYDISVDLQTGRNGEILGTGRERKVDLRFDDQRLKLFSLPARGRRANIGSGIVTKSADESLKVHLSVKAGTHAISATFFKDTVLPEGIVFPPRSENVVAFFEGMGGITVAGPYNVQGPGETPSRDKIFVCHPGVAAEEDACAEKILSKLAHHAYRRPIGAGDVRKLMSLYKQGAGTGGFDSGIRLALQKILVSPNFLFRAEIDPPDMPPGTAYRVNDVELASRLSFFLWSSIPDDELLGVAERGELSDPAMLEKQVRRMLADPRAHALVDNFVGQWLFLRNIPNLQPDVTSFTYFDDNLRQSLKKETELLIENEMREDRSIVHLLSTDYSFVNQRLAEHYGIEGIYGTEFRRVAINDPRRQGLLGQGSISMVTAYPNRTAPTIRGKWVLEQLLGSPPPPPPPNVPALKIDEQAKVITMRQRMEQHRVAPQCAVCHRLMDPIGFALDNFDGVGMWRDTDGGIPIDPNGVLPDGSHFDGPVGLREIIINQKRELFVQNFTERLLTYALGRGVEEYDRPVIRKIVREARDEKWSSIILAVIRSKPFQMVQAKGA
jgi:hypothetical protein